MGNKVIFLKRKSFWFLAGLLFLFFLVSFAFTYLVQNNNKLSTFIFNILISWNFNISQDVVNIINLSITGIFFIWNFSTMMKGYSYNKKETHLFLNECNSPQKYSNLNLVGPVLFYFLVPFLLLTLFIIQTFELILISNKLIKIIILINLILLAIGFIGMIITHFRYDRIQRKANAAISHHIKIVSNNSMLAQQKMKQREEQYYRNVSIQTQLLEHLYEQKRYQNYLQNYLSNAYLNNWKEDQYRNKLEENESYDEEEYEDGEYYDDNNFDTSDDITGPLLNNSVTDVKNKNKTSKKLSKSKNKNDSLDNSYKD